ncbi:hypothetical protein [Ammoniphilus sp. 3BR4]|uniref:hypothetical protein n=1 Tax=Ammoniphilus sp. 3BR4 TaxID=3158265 RepID=UPI003465EFBE
MIRKIRVINKKTKKAVVVSSRKMGKVKQLDTLAQAIEDLYDRLDSDKDFADDWEDACRRCRRRRLRRLFGREFFRDFDGFIRCENRRFRGIFYHCCHLYFEVDDFLVSFDFCYERNNHNDD